MSTFAVFQMHPAQPQTGIVFWSDVDLLDVPHPTRLRSYATVFVDRASDSTPSAEGTSFVQSQEMGQNKLRSIRLLATRATLGKNWSHRSHQPPVAKLSRGEVFAVCTV